MVDKVENRFQFNTPKENALREKRQDQIASAEAVSIEMRNAQPLTIEQAEDLALDLAARITLDPNRAESLHQLTHKAIDLLSPL